MTNDDIMYQFKGQIMKELSRNVTKNVNIDIFYKPESDFVGVILSIPTDSSSSKLYRIEDAWGKIKEMTLVETICAPIIKDYKGFILSRYFRPERRVANENRQNS